jgi:hypothetical protein
MRKFVKIRETATDVVWMNFLSELFSNNSSLFGNRMEVIPEDILKSIFEFVPLKFLFRCEIVCKKWFKILRKEELWFQWSKKYVSDHRFTLSAFSDISKLGETSWRTFYIRGNIQFIFNVVEMTGSFCFGDPVWVNPQTIGSLVLSENRNFVEATPSASS